MVGQSLIRKLSLPYRPPEAVLANWPADFPICFLGGTGRFALLAVDFEECSFAEFICQRARPAAYPLGFDDEEPIGGPGYVGLVSYDEFDTAERFDLGSSSRRQASRLWRVRRAIVWDQEKGKVFLSGEATQPSGLAHAPAPSGKRSQLDNERLDAVWSGAERSSSTAAEPAWSLQAYADADAYLAMCRQALADIRAGRYYQVNLLRYFAASGPSSRPALARRLAAFAGPQAAWISTPELDLISFSPERFVRLWPTRQGLRALSEPIKGTARRYSEAVADRAAAARLLASPKDRAELHMIVDLMRNDLQRIACHRSVKVLQAAHVQSFAHVHHLVASVSALLVEDLSWHDILASLCPGGSITGAPKREVMSAIATYEGRRRGYFMGQIFYWDDSGYTDSSILIRTLVGQADCDKQELSYSYAAGSGIVVASSPEEELAEISAKCGVVTAAL